MIKLKILAVAFFFIDVSTVQAGLKASQFGPKLQAFAEPVHSKCLSETGIDEASVAALKSGKFVDTPKVKSYVGCLFREANVVNSQGNLNLEIPAEILPEEVKDETLENIKYCYDETKGVELLEEKLFAVIKCYHDLNPYAFVFF